MAALLCLRVVSGMLGGRVARLPCVLVATMTALRAGGLRDHKIAC